MKVKDVMVIGAVTIDHGENVNAAARLMRDQNVGMLIVSDHGHMAGIITDRDLTVRCVSEGHRPNECFASSHMSTPVISIDLETDVLATARVIREMNVKRLPVTEAGALTGVISITDIAQALDQPLRDVLFGTGKPRRVPVSVLVGQVAHYYTQIRVAAFRVEAPIHVGNAVSVLGRTTRLSFIAESMEINNKKVDAAYPGDDVALNVPSRVRPGDSIYVESSP